MMFQNSIVLHSVNVLPNFIKLKKNVRFGPELIIMSALKIWNAQFLSYRTTEVLEWWETGLAL